MNIRLGSIVLLVICFGTLSSCSSDDTDPVLPGSIGSSGSIEFTSDQIVVFTGPDEDFHLSAVVKDDDGNVNTSAQVTWSSLDPAIATVTGDGTVKSVGNFGSTLVAASYGDLLPVVATVVIAELTPVARLIHSEDVVSITGDELQVVLTVNERTQGLASGDVVMSGDKGGVLVRVLGVQDNGNQVELTTEPADLTSFYRRLSIDIDAPRVPFEEEIVDPGTKILDCNAGAQIDVSFTGFQFRPTFNIGFEFEYELVPDPADPNQSKLESIHLVAVGSLGAKVSLASLALGGRGVVECKESGPSVPIIRFPIGGPVSVGPNFKPVWGLGAERELEVGRFTCGAPDFERTYDFAAGLQWTEGAGLDLIHEVIPSGPGIVLPDDWGWSLPLLLKMKVELFAGLEFPLVLSAGPVSITQLDFARVKGGGGLRVSEDIGVQEEHRDWQGWRKSAFVGVSGDLKPLFDQIQDFSGWLRRIGYKGRPFNFDYKLFEITNDLAQIVPPILEAETSSDGASIELVATVSEDSRLFVPEVEFFMYHPDDPATERTSLGRASCDPSQGKASMTWTPPAEEPGGEETGYLFKAVSRGILGDYFDLGSPVVEASVSSCPPGPVLLILELAGAISGQGLLEVTFTPHPDQMGSEIRGPGTFGEWVIECAEGLTDYDELRNPVYQLQLTLVGNDGKVIDLFGTSIEELPPDGPADFILHGQWSVIEGPDLGQSGTFKWFITG